MNVQLRTLNGERDRAGAEARSVEMADGKAKMENGMCLAMSGEWPGYEVWRRFCSALHVVGSAGAAKDMHHEDSKARREVGADAVQARSGYYRAFHEQHDTRAAAVLQPFESSSLRGGFPLPSPRLCGSAVSIFLGLQAVAGAAGNPDAPSNNDGSDPLSIGKWLICLGALFWIYNQAREALAAKGPAQVEQPIRTTAEYPFVEKPDFETHKEEIWEVVNGLRRAVSRIEADISAIKALREANGERLAEMARDMKKLSDQISRLAGMMEVRD
jgi:hypothetical protein